MIPLPELKLKILKYKKTKDPLIFAEILLSVDYLILYYIKKSKRWLPYIRKIEMSELYHTSILALHKFLITYPLNWRETHIPCRLHAYMISEFKSTYSYLFKELQGGRNGMSNARRKYYGTSDYTEIDVAAIEYRLYLSNLSYVDAEVLNSYITKTSSITEMAKKNGIKPAAMSRRVRKLLNKLKEFSDEDR